MLIFSRQKCHIRLGLLAFGYNRTRSAAPAASLWRCSSLFAGPPSIRPSFRPSLHTCCPQRCLGDRIPLRTPARSHVELAATPTVVLHAHPSNTATLQSSKRRTTRIIRRSSPKTHRQRFFTTAFSLRFIRLHQRCRQETPRCRRVQYPGRRPCTRSSSQRAEANRARHPHHIRSTLPTDRRSHRATSRLFLLRPHVLFLARSGIIHAPEELPL